MELGVLLQSAALLELVPVAVEASLQPLASGLPSPAVAFALPSPEASSEVAPVLSAAE